MWNFKTMIKTTVSIRSIYECRKVPVFISVLFFIFINVGFAFPFVLSVIKMDQINVTNYIPVEAVEQFEQEDQYDFLNQLSVADGKLTGDVPEGITKIQLDQYIIIIDPRDQWIQTEEEGAYSAHLTEDYIEIDVGVQMISDYSRFDTVDLTDMTKTEILNYFLKNTLASTMKQWVAPLFTFFYLVFLFMNSFFVGGMSLLALLFRVGDRVKLTYKETLNIVIYSSVIPILIASLSCIFLNMLGINLLIYNFGTFFVYMIVRKRFLKNPKLPIGEI